MEDRIIIGPGSQPRIPLSPLEKQLEQVLQRLQEFEDMQDNILTLIGKIGTCFDALKAVVDTNIAEIGNLENRVDHLESK